MDIVVKKMRSCDILTVVGKIDSQNSAQFVEALINSIDQGAKNIVIDMTGVVFISSAGLEVLLRVNADKRFKKRKGCLVLTNVPDNIMSALELTSIKKVIRTMDTVLDAVDSFTK